MSYSYLVRFRRTWTFVIKIKELQDATINDMAIQKIDRAMQGPIGAARTTDVSIFYTSQNIAVTLSLKFNRSFFSIKSTGLCLNYTLSQIIKEKKEPIFDYSVNFGHKNLEFVVPTMEWDAD